MSRRRVMILVAQTVVVAACGVVYVACGRTPAIVNPQTADRPPRIRPDYTDTTIPPNIAPLNFTVLEDARRSHARIRGDRGEAIEVHSDSASIVIPPGPWRRLLEANRGGKIHVDVCVLGESGRWTRFRTITNTVAREEIDSHLVYRLIRPLYNFYRNVGIYQRDLTTYEQKEVLHGRSFGKGCVNCHTFLNHDSSRMLVHIRGGAGGVAMLLADEAGVRRIDTRTKHNRSPASYSSWHPGGEMVTFSVNSLSLFMHSTGETRDVFDSGSDLGLYLPASNAVRSTRGISQPDGLETFPCWAPDGRSLYFCRAARAPMAEFRLVRYDLMRIAYDPASQTWGKPEVVLSSRRTGLSITEPRVSPDGRFLMFCMAPYGNFTVYQPASDLYLMERATGKVRKLPVNSDACESWHCWSSNGRWFVFSSKRRDGLLAKPHFSHFDESGRCGKPFVLPQRDPEFYESFLFTYNVPELVKQPVRHAPEDFLRAIECSAEAKNAIVISGATPRIPGDGNQPPPGPRTDGPTREGTYE